MNLIMKSEISFSVSSKHFWRFQSQWWHLWKFGLNPNWKDQNLTNFFENAIDNVSNWGKISSHVHKRNQISLRLLLENINWNTDKCFISFSDFLFFNKIQLSVKPSFRKSQIEYVNWNLKIEHFYSDDIGRFWKNIHAED